MPRSIPAQVRPELLVWARSTAGLTREIAANKAQVKPESLHEWEAGTSSPTIPQLRKLGEVYKRPIAVFFLSEPPQGFDPQREFRRLPGVTPQNESPELRFALRTALFRREAAKEVYERLGERVPTLEGAVTPEEDPEAVGIRIRELLGVNWETQVDWPSAYAALNAWREAVEETGVLVFQTGGIDLQEMRGTSIPHGPLPVIVINNADAPHGRIFTLLHEFTHILLGNSGHETSPMEGRRLPEEQTLEQASNRFTAAALMPRQDFLRELESHRPVLRGDDNALRRFANRIKVSPEAILRRLLSLRRISAQLYRQKRQEWQGRSWFPQPDSEGGPPIQVRVISRVGRAFVSLILEGYQRNAISSVDVSDYLGIQLKYLDRVAAELVTRPGAPAY
jgi:Zn-dependent peptidase ImmA (M78 family)/DNA-binding XRE family transcriptional regulator